MTRARLMLVAPLLAAACADDEVPADLGSRAEDNVVLADDPRLAYLAASLEGGEDFTVSDLFFAERLRFTAAPDPTPLLELQAAEHAGLPPLTDGVPLRVLSYNLGLLDRWYPFTHVGPPQVDARRARAPEELLAGGWDVICLQEVFELEDVDRFAAEADERGYSLYFGSKDRHVQHGLVILVRDEIIGDPAQERAEVQYEAQREIEFFPGPWVKRGYLRWSFTHAPTGRRVHVYDTHLTSFPELWPERISQARVIGGAARDHGDDDVVFVAGDFNAGPYYPEDRFGEVDGETLSGWWRNATMYPLMLHYGGLVDTHSLLAPAPDVARMGQLLLPFDAGRYTAEPLAGRCDEVPNDAFTGTDCNSLYAMQYVATEYPSRLDYIMLRDPGEHVRVVASELLFTEPLDFGAAGSFELSDHYAYAATVQIAP